MPTFGQRRLPMVDTQEVVREFVKALEQEA